MSKQVLYGALAESSWRTLLFWLGPPGLVVAGLCLLTLDEPRKPAGNFLGDPFASSKFTNPATRALNRSGTDCFAEARRCPPHTSVDSCMKNLHVFAHLPSMCPVASFMLELKSVTL